VVAVDELDLFSASTSEPARESTGSLGKILQYAQQAEQGQLDPLEAIRRAKAEAEAFLERQRQLADEVTQAREGKVARNPRATSAKAARNIAPKAGTQRGRVLAAIAEHGGLTDFELAERLGMLDNSIRPRRAELLDACLVRDAGRVRQHRGHWWVVWEATEAGLGWYRGQQHKLGGAA
jgi:hypothetical protein